MDTNFDNMSDDHFGGGGGGNFFQKILKNKRFLIFVVFVVVAIIVYFVIKSKLSKKNGNFVALNDNVTENENERDVTENENERDVEKFMKHDQRQQQQHAAPKVRESMDVDGTMDGGFQGFGDVRGNASNSFIKNLESKFANPAKRNVGN